MTRADMEAMIRRALQRRVRELYADRATVSAERLTQVLAEELDRVQARIMAEVLDTRD